jgi:hypothetical protein
MEYIHVLSLPWLPFSANMTRGRPAARRDGGCAGRVGGRGRRRPARALHRAAYLRGADISPRGGSRASTVAPATQRQLRRGLARGRRRGRRHKFSRRRRYYHAKASQTPLKLSIF